MSDDKMREAVKVVTGFLREISVCEEGDRDHKLEDALEHVLRAAQRQGGEAETRALLTRTAANLIAATHLLEDGGRKSAPSDQMFEQMLSDYKRVVSDVQDFLKSAPQPQPAVPESTRRDLLQRVVSELGIMDDSQGVAGFHMNGEVSPWDEGELPALRDEIKETLMAETSPAVSETACSAPGPSRKLLETLDYLMSQVDPVCWISRRQAIWAHHEVRRILGNGYDKPEPKEPNQ